MKTTFFVRTASLSDLPELKALLLRSPYDWTPITLANSFCYDYHHWVIENHLDGIIGFLVMRVVLDHWELMQIGVDLPYRSQGCGLQLLQYAIDEAKRKNVRKIQLEVRLSNRFGMALYRRCGFEQVGSRKKYYTDGEDAVLMDLKLS